MRNGRASAIAAQPFDPASPHSVATRSLPYFVKYELTKVRNKVRTKVHSKVCTNAGERLNQQVFVRQFGP